MKDYSQAAQLLGTRDEIIIVGYDGLVQIPELYFFEKVFRSHYPSYNKFFNLDLFKNLDEVSAVPVILQRKEKNIVKWLSRNEMTDKDSQELCDDLWRRHKTAIYKEAPFTDFMKGLNNLMSQKSISKLVFILEDVDKNLINRISELFDVYNINKITVLDRKGQDLFDLIQSAHPDFTTLIIDDDDVINKYVEQVDCTTKTFILPYTGYNFKVENDILMSKKELEIASVEKGISVGFIQPVNFTEEHFSVG